MAAIDINPGYRWLLLNVIDVFSQSKRRPLSSKLRHQPTSIPEEDEEESDETDNDEDDKEDDQDDEQGSAGEGERSR